jgi:antitoxin YefM
MGALTYAQVRQNLARTMDAVCEDRTPVIITRPNAEAVVLMSLADYNGFMETAYLLANPQNVARLREFLAQAQKGQYEEKQ